MKKTILHIIDYMGRGGDEVMLVKVLKELKEYNNIVVTLNPQNHFVEEFTCDEYHCLNMGSFANLPMAVIKLKRFIKKHKIDLVHSHLLLSVGLDELPTGPEGAELWLDPGRQRITARDGDKSAGREIEVVAGAEAVIVDLSFETAPPPTPAPPRPVAAPQPRFPTRAWLALSGIVGAANVLTGIVILPVGALRGGRQLGALPTGCEPGLELDRCRDRLAEATTLRGAGAGLLGAGLGVLAGGLTGLARGARTRKAAWSAELGVGATFGMVGAGLLAYAVLLVILRQHGRFNPRVFLPMLRAGTVAGRGAGRRRRRERPCPVGHAVRRGARHGHRIRDGAGRAL